MDFSKIVDLIVEKFDGPKNSEIKRAVMASLGEGKFSTALTKADLIQTCFLLGGHIMGQNQSEGCTGGTASTNKATVQDNVKN